MAKLGLSLRKLQKILAFHNYLLQEVVFFFSFSFVIQLVKEQVVSKLWAHQANTTDTMMEKEKISAPRSGGCCVWLIYPPSFLPPQLVICAAPGGLRELALLSVEQEKETVNILLS